ncbi:MAG: hypothetical protein HKN42_05550, partial [Granulosicoccus sp.]|nr:hypothetical protein [Granulosicoccus sp.]
LSAVDVTFADERLQDYFYQVDPAYVNEQRPLYDASGGYLETRWLAGVGLRPLRSVRVFIGVFTGFYQGARNRASALYETTSSTGFALGVVWTIKSSDAFVDIVDMGSNQ